MASLVFASCHSHAVVRSASADKKSDNDGTNGCQPTTTQHRRLAVAAPIRRGESDVDTTTAGAAATRSTAAVDVLATSTTPRRAALVSAAALALSAVVPPTRRAAANPLDDFADTQLASKAKLFMGPIALAFERLNELQATEATLTVDELAQALGNATLDCLNPRGPLAAYANVRDVCTLNILVRSATAGPAAKNAPDSDEATNVVAAAQRLRESYDDLAAELAREPSGGSRDAAFAKSRGLLREFAPALLACFRLPGERSSAIEAVFPDLFA